MTEETHRSSLYYVIPAQVFNDERLSAQELKLYGLVSGLAQACGYCYASNDYLAKRMKCDSRSVARWLECLESCGYINRLLTQNEKGIDRKIFISHGTVATTPWHGSHDPSCQVCHDPMTGVSPPYIGLVSEVLVSKERENKKAPSAPKKSAAPPSPPPVSLKKSFGSHVKLSEEEYQDFVKILGKPFLDGLIEKMNDYIDSKDVKPYKDYAAALRNWAKSDYNGRGAMTIQGTSIEACKTLANDIFKRIPMNNPGKVDVGYDYIQFISGNFVEVIKFGEFGFRERCLNQLRKWKIPLTDL